jgi:hypothetical protein
MQIINGKIESAQKVVIYGPEGIGKSSFAARFPYPLFIDTEGSTKFLDVRRTPTPTSWNMLLSLIIAIKAEPTVCQTLILDTIDWTEMLCSTHVCAKSRKTSIEEFGYGKGWTYLQEEFGKLLNLLSELIDLNIHVVFTAHAMMRKFEQPDELGAYDRWELKLSKKCAPLVKEWTDMLLFVNYKTHVVNVDGQGATKGVNKAQGGSRIMYTTHHPCWDAKNRYDLPSDLPFQYDEISHIFGSTNQAAALSMPIEVKTPTETEMNQLWDSISRPQPKDDGIPQALKDLMQRHNVTEADIQGVVGARGYFPGDMPIKDYPADFVEDILIAAWPQVVTMIKKAG